MTSQRERGKNMVLDHFKNIHLYKTMYPRLSVAIDYMQATDLSEMPVGRYEIAGDEVFIMIQAYEQRQRKTVSLNHIRITLISSMSLNGQKVLVIVIRMTLRYWKPTIQKKMLFSMMRNVI